MARSVLYWGMEKHVLDAVKHEFPDWEEWIGELYIQWPSIHAQLRGLRSKDARWQVLTDECRRVRREVQNEGRPSRTIYLGNMDHLDG